MQYYKTNYQCILGTIVIVSTLDSIVGLYFRDRQTFDYSAVENHRLDVLNLAKHWLDEYFIGNNPSVDLLPLHLSGSMFQVSVWNCVRNIAYGSTMTYGQLAKYMECNLSSNKKVSARCVGSALSKNPISIVIPCHRVIGSRGSPTGYNAGVDIKIKLLELEGVYTR